MTREISAGSSTINGELKAFKLFYLFDHLDTEPDKNIVVIVKHAFFMLGGSCAVYSRVDENNSRVCVCAAWPPSEKIPNTTDAQGRVCYEVTMYGENHPVAFEDLEATPYSMSDPVIREHGFRSYLGHPVYEKEKPVGSLCIFDTKKRRFVYLDKQAITTLAKALSLEEDRKRVREALNTRLSSEKMLVEISTQAMTVRSVSNLLDGCLEQMGQALDVDGIFVWEYDLATDTVSNTSEWIREGYPPQKEKLQDIPAGAFPWAMEILRNKRIINFKDIEDIPEGEEKNIMRMMNIKSILIIPFFLRGEFHGGIGFEVYRRQKEWLDEDIYVLETAARIMSKSLENYLAERELEQGRKELEKRVLARTAELKMAMSELEQKHQELVKNKTELEKVNTALMKTNTALATLASNFEREKKEIQQNVAHTIHLKIMPFILSLQAEALDQRCQARLDVLVAHIRELTKELGVEENIFSSLSPSEACIAAMIRQGLTSREIADQLNISLETVKTHRRNIRKKLRLINTKKNLRMYLRSKMDTRSK